MMCVMPQSCAQVTNGKPVPTSAPTERAIIGPGGEALNAYVERSGRCGAFSGAVLVARGDTILLHGGYGLADQRLGIPVTRSTVFDIGSVAKQFAAAAILHLEMEGRLRVDDPLSLFFPEAPADKRNITVHQLLTHTSGLPGDLESAGERITLPDAPDLAARLLAVKLETDPGTTFRYSNAGYSLVRLVVERASGIPFKQYVTEHLLQPAGLTRTGWHGDSTLWRPEEVAHGAWGLYDSGSPRDWSLYGATFGGGQMVSSPGEMFAWVKALRSDAILNAEERNKMFTPRAMWSGAGAAERGQGAQYAYGWEVRLKDDGTVGLIFHNGIYDNFRTSVRRYTRDDAVVIVMTNSRQQDAGDRADEVANALRDIMVGDTVALAPLTSDIPGDVVAAVTGDYELKPENRYHVWSTPGERVWISPHGQKAFDALWSPDAERSALNTRVMERTKALVDSLGRLPCKDASSGWARMFCGLVERFGPFERAEFEGVAPISWSADRSMSYTVLHFAHGRISMSWIWRGTELIKTMSADDVSEPQSVPIAPTSAHDFITYDWFTGRSMPIMFKLEVEGTELRVGEGALSVRAAKLRR